MGVLGTITVVLGVLKVLGLITVSWLVVFSPVLIGVVGWVLMMLFLLFFSK